VKVGEDGHGSGFAPSRWSDGTVPRPPP
jgi:hypothetical protein